MMSRSERDKKVVFYHGMPWSIEDLHKLILKEFHFRQEHGGMNPCTQNWVKADDSRLLSQMLEGKFDSLFPDERDDLECLKVHLRESDTQSPECHTDFFTSDDFEASQDGESTPCQDEEEQEHAGENGTTGRDSTPLSTLWNSSGPEEARGSGGSEKSDLAFSHADRQLQEQDEISASASCLTPTVTFPVSEGEKEKILKFFRNSRKDRFIRTSPVDQPLNDKQKFCHQSVVKMRILMGKIKEFNSSDQSGCGEEELTLIGKILKASSDSEVNTGVKMYFLEDTRKPEEMTGMLCINGIPLALCSGSSLDELISQLINNTYQELSSNKAIQVCTQSVDLANAFPVESETVQLGVAEYGVCKDIWRCDRSEDSSQRSFEEKLSPSSPSGVELRGVDESSPTHDLSQSLMDSMGEDDTTGAGINGRESPLPNCSSNETLEQDDDKADAFGSVAQNPQSGSSCGYADEDSMFAWDSLDQALKNAMDRTSSSSPLSQDAVHSETGKTERSLLKAPQLKNYAQLRKMLCRDSDPSFAGWDDSARTKSLDLGKRMEFAGREGCDEAYKSPQRGNVSMREEGRYSVSQSRESMIVSLQKEDPSAARDEHDSGHEICHVRSVSEEEWRSYEPEQKQNSSQVFEIAIERNGESSSDAVVESDGSGSQVEAGFEQQIREEHSEEEQKGCRTSPELFNAESAGSEDFTAPIGSINGSAEKDGNTDSKVCPEDEFLMKWIANEDSTYMWSETGHQEIQPEVTATGPMPLDDGNSIALVCTSQSPEPCSRDAENCQNAALRHILRDRMLDPPSASASPLSEEEEEACGLSEDAQPAELNIDLQDLSKDGSRITVPPSIQENSQSLQSDPDVICETLSVEEGSKSEGSQGNDGALDISEDLDMESLARKRAAILQQLEQASNLPESEEEDGAVMQPDASVAEDLVAEDVVAEDLEEVSDDAVTEQVRKCTADSRVTLELPDEEDDGAEVDMILLGQGTESSGASGSPSCTSHITVPNSSKVRPKRNHIRKRSCSSPFNENQNAAGEGGKRKKKKKHRKKVKEPLRECRHTHSKRVCFFTKEKPQLSWRPRSFKDWPSEQKCKLIKLPRKTFDGHRVQGIAPVQGNRGLETAPQNRGRRNSLTTKAPGKRSLENSGDSYRRSSSNSNHVTCRKSQEVDQSPSALANRKTRKRDSVNADLSLSRERNSGHKQRRSSPSGRRDHEKKSDESPRCRVRTGSLMHILERTESRAGTSEPKRRRISTAENMDHKLAHSKSHHEERETEEANDVRVRSSTRERTSETRDRSNPTALQLSSPSTQLRNSPLEVNIPDSISRHDLHQRNSGPRDQAIEERADGRAALPRDHDIEARNSMDVMVEPVTGSSSFLSHGDAVGREFCPGSEENLDDESPPSRDISEVSPNLQAFFGSKSGQSEADASRVQYLNWTWEAQSDSHNSLPSDSCPSPLQQESEINASPPTQTCSPEKPTSPSISEEQAFISPKPSWMQALFSEGASKSRDISSEGLEKSTSQSSTDPALSQIRCSLSVDVDVVASKPEEMYSPSEPTLDLCPADEEKKNGAGYPSSELQDREAESANSERQGGSILWQKLVALLEEPRLKTFLGNKTLDCNGLEESELAILLEQLKKMAEDTSQTKKVTEDPSVAETGVTLSAQEKSGSESNVSICDQDMEKEETEPRSECTRMRSLNQLQDVDVNEGSDNQSRIFHIDYESLSSSRSSASLSSNSEHVVPELDVVNSKERNPEEWSVAHGSALNRTRESSQNSSTSISSPVYETSPSNSGRIVWSSSWEKPSKTGRPLKGCQDSLDSTSSPSPVSFEGVRRRSHQSPPQRAEGMKSMQHRHGSTEDRPRSLAGQKVETESSLGREPRSPVFDGRRPNRLGSRRHDQRPILIQDVDGSPAGPVDGGRPEASLEDVERCYDALRKMGPTVQYMCCRFMKMPPPDFCHDQDLWNENTGAMLERQAELLGEQLLQQGITQNLMQCLALGLDRTQIPGGLQRFLRDREPPKQGASPSLKARSPQAEDTHQRSKSTLSRSSTCAKKDLPAELWRGSVETLPRESSISPQSHRRIISMKVRKGNKRESPVSRNVSLGQRHPRARRDDEDLSPSPHVSSSRKVVRSKKLKNVWEDSSALSHVASQREDCTSSSSHGTEDVQMDVEGSCSSQGNSTAYQGMSPDLMKSPGIAVIPLRNLSPKEAVTPVDENDTEHNSFFRITSERDPILEKDFEGPSDFSGAATPASRILSSDRNSEESGNSLPGRVAVTKGKENVLDQHHDLSTSPRGLFSVWGGPLELQRCSREEKNTDSASSKTKKDHEIRPLFDSLPHDGDGQMLTDHTKMDSVDGSSHPGGYNVNQASLVPQLDEPASQKGAWTPSAIDHARQQCIPDRLGLPTVAMQGIANRTNASDQGILESADFCGTAAVSTRGLFEQTESSVAVPSNDLMEECRDAELRRCMSRRRAERASSDSRRVAARFSSAVHRDETPLSMNYVDLSEESASASLSSKGLQRRSLREPVVDSTRVRQGSDGMQVGNSQRVIRDSVHLVQSQEELLLADPRRPSEESSRAKKTSALQFLNPKGFVENSIPGLQNSCKLPSASTEGLSGDSTLPIQNSGASVVSREASRVSALTSQSPERPNSQNRVGSGTPISPDLAGQLSKLLNLTLIKRHVDTLSPQCDPQCALKAAVRASNIDEDLLLMMAAWETPDTSCRYKTWLGFDGLLLGTAVGNNRAEVKTEVFHQAFTLLQRTKVKDLITLVTELPTLPNPPSDASSVKYKPCGCNVRANKDMSANSLAMTEMCLMAKLQRICNNILSISCQDPALVDKVNDVALSERFTFLLVQLYDKQKGTLTSQLYAGGVLVGKGATLVDAFCELVLLGKLTTRVELATLLAQAPRLTLQDRFSASFVNMSLMGAKLRPFRDNLQQLVACKLYPPNLAEPLSEMVFIEFFDPPKCLFTRLALMLACNGMLLTSTHHSLQSEDPSKPSKWRFILYVQNVVFVEATGASKLEARQKAVSSALVKMRKECDVIKFLPPSVPRLTVDTLYLRLSLLLQRNAMPVPTLTNMFSLCNMPWALRATREILAELGAELSLSWTFTRSLPGEILEEIRGWADSRGFHAVQEATTIKVSRFQRTLTAQERLRSLQVPGVCLKEGFSILRCSRHRLPPAALLRVEQQILAGAPILG